MALLKINDLELQVGEAGSVPITPFARAYVARAHTRNGGNGKRPLRPLIRRAKQESFGDTDVATNAPPAYTRAHNHGGAP